MNKVRISIRRDNTYNLMLFLAEYKHYWLGFNSEEYGIVVEGKKNVEYIPSPDYKLIYERVVEDDTPKTIMINTIVEHFIPEHPEYFI